DTECRWRGHHDVLPRGRPLHAKAPRRLRRRVGGRPRCRGRHEAGRTLARHADALVPHHSHAPPRRGRLEGRRRRNDGRQSRFG
ncbi:hypothetical protein C9890_0594, partial [Perkinsus sp. BL_2016]